VIWLQTATVFWQGGGIIYLSYWMYIGWHTYSRADSAQTQCIL